MQASDAALGAAAAAANELGVAFLTEEENALASAYQLDTCIQSSGLFSYFELQSHWAQLGVNAMVRLEVPQLEEMLLAAHSELGLAPDADEGTIETATKNLVGGEPFIKLLDAFEPLEEIYYSNHDALVAAFISFAAKNSSALSRKSSQGHKT